MKIYYAFLILFISLSGCFPCDPIHLDNGPIPAECLAWVPYQDGQSYQFKHSEGLVITFRAIREMTASEKNPDLFDGKIEDDIEPGLSEGAQEIEKDFEELHNQDAVEEITPELEEEKEPE